MRDFFKHYQIGCWYYKTTSYDLTYNCVDMEKELGFTYITLPEHWHHRPIDEVKLDELVKKCDEENIPCIMFESRLFQGNPNVDITLDGVEKEVKRIADRFKDSKSLVGLFVRDEPQWGLKDHTDLDGLKKYVDIVNKNAPQYFPLVSTLGVPGWKFKEDVETLKDYIETIRPEVLFFNMYSQCMFDEQDKEQGILNYFNQMYVFTYMAKKYNLPVWISLMDYAVWIFREPDEFELRWQLNTACAHGIKGFVWYYMHECKVAQGRNVIDYYGNKTPRFYQLAYENKAFKEEICDKLEGYELDHVYHVYQRFANFDALELCDDEIIDRVKPRINSPLIVSKFVNSSDPTKIRIMVTNNSFTKINGATFTFKGKYEKYNTFTYLERGSAKVIDLFDENK